MRNLKRALSMALAAVMVLGLMVVGASAASYNDFTDKDEIVHKDAVAMVTELGVLAGLPDGSFGGTQNIDRASFARLVCVVLNGGKEPVLGNLTTTFTDTQGNWAEKYIAFCVDRGIIAGRGNNTFGPADNVTGSEAAKMLLVALGYNTQYEGIGGSTWEITTNSLANMAGLYKDLETINPSAPLTRDDAAQMIYNVLNAETVTYSFTFNANGTTTAVQNKTGKTMLEEKFGVIIVEGIVTGNEYANLESAADKGSALKENETYVAVTNYGDKLDQNVFGSGKYAVSTGADVLGKSVTMYVKNDSTNTSKATVVGSPIVTDDNVVVTTAAQKELAKLASDNDLKLADDTKVVENYADAGKWSGYTSAAAAAADRGVSKTLIDNNDDGTADYILINTAYFGQVSKYSTKDDGSITINTSGKADPALTADDKDDVVGFDDVAKDDYVIASWIGGKLHVEKAESITGTLQAYKQDSDKTTTSSLTVDGTDYNVSKVAGFTGGADEINAPTGYGKNNLDTEATFYLDQNGYIVAVGNVSENAYNFAYLWAYEKGTAFDDARAKVTLSDGTTKTYTVDKVVNGTTDITDTAVAAGIYNYSINSDGELKLTVPSKLGSEKDNTYYVEKGKTAIGDNQYATSSTVFFYVELDKSNNVKDVDVYVGYKNAPTIAQASGLKGTVVTNGSNAKNVNALALTGTDVSATSDDVKNHLYITEIGSEYTDYTLVNAIFAGSDEITENVKVDTSDLNGTGLYLYTKGSDDIYTLDAIGSNELTVNGSVANISDSTINYAGAEYDLTSNTVLVDLSGSDPVAYLGVLPTSTDYIVSMLVDDTKDGDLLMIVIDNSKGTMLDPSADDITNAFKSNDTVTVAGKLPTTMAVPEDKTLVLGGTVSGTTTISGAGTVKLVGNTINGNVTVSAAKAEVTGMNTLSASSELVLPAATTYTTGAGFDVVKGAKLTLGSTKVTDVLTGAGFTVKHNGKGTDYIITENMTLGGNLTITTSDTLTVNEKVTLDVASNTLKIDGNVTVNGTITGSGKFTFNDEANVNVSKTGDIQGSATVDGENGAKITVTKALTADNLNTINAEGTWTYDGSTTWTKG